MSKAKKIRVNLASRSYDIVICHNETYKLGSYIKKVLTQKNAVIVTTALLKKLIGKKVEKSLSRSGFTVDFMTMPNGEKAKSEKYCLRLLNNIARLDSSKKRLFVVALGGGVIGDLAGFVASIYRRGIPYVQIPTTLLGQVDSSVGGKVAIDLSVGKNLVGSFYQPKLVFIDTFSLKTLPKKELLSGLSEVIKYGIIKSPELFNLIEKDWKKILKLEGKTIQHVVEMCCNIKASVVAQDEYDNKGKRIILNLGHTIGHAIETAANYKRSYSHGQAVALGTLCALSISCSMGLANKDIHDRVKELFLKLKLPTRIQGLKISDIMLAQEHDKKFVRGKNRFVLPVSIGKTVIKEGVPRSIIEDSVKQLL